MIKPKCHSLIIGGTSQFAITLKNQLNKKKEKVVISSRFKKFTIKKNFTYWKKMINLMIKKYLKEGNN